MYNIKLPISKLMMIIISFGLFIPSFTHAQEYYECVVSVDPSKGDVCEEYRGRVHMCQLYDWTYTDGTPSYCSGFCLNHSEIPAECATITVRESNNPQAHEGRADIIEQTGLDIHQLEGVAGEVRDRLAGIENEINTEDGVDADEVKYVVGRIVTTIKDILGDRVKSKIEGVFGGDDGESEISTENDTDDSWLDDEENPFADTGLEATQPGEYRTEKWPDEDGTKIAKIVDAYGVEKYTSDGKHFYDSPYDAAHSGEGVSNVINGVKDTWGNITGWFSKSKEPNKDTQLQFDIAREVLADTKSQSEKDIEKAYEKLSGAVNTPTFGDVPAKAVIEVAKELPAKDFASAASVYIQEREKGNSQASIRENNSEILSEGYGTFGNQGEVSLSTTNKYATAVLYARYEEVYQRYKLAKELGRTE